MATVCCSRLRQLLGWVYISLILVLPVGSNDALDELPAQRSSSHSGMVHFNNPKLLKGADKALNGGDGYAFDTRQEAVDPRKMGGIRIENEARRLSSKLRRLSNNEIGVTAMQVSVYIIFRSGILS